MNMNDHVVFIPISDTEIYSDWDDNVGFGGQDQLVVDGGIIVLKVREEEFKDHVDNFEKWLEIGLD